MSTEPIKLHNLEPAPRRGANRKRLPFVLPDFNRQSWVSELARTVWEPRIARISQAWNYIEWLSAAVGIRACALLWISPKSLQDLMRLWEANHLSAIRLDVKEAESHKLTEGLICVVVGELTSIQELCRAWAASDHEQVGSLLGYPACCRTFFHDVWVEQRCIDTTWAMAENTPQERINDSVRIKLSNGVRSLANILGRWAGVRAVPHLPCRLDCSATIGFGERLLDLGRKAGYVEEVEWIEQILSWPVEWSALHGIAEVKLPIMKISTRTDATSGKSVVQWPGTTYPEEGAIGVRFPYQVPDRLKLTSTAGYQRGLAHRLESTPDATWHYADNGFGSMEMMHELHRPIVSLARSVIVAERADVLDLGCGNGLLVGKICQGCPQLVLHGIDQNEVALAHARELFPQFAKNFVQGDLFDVNQWGSGSHKYGVALLMLGRLLEVRRERAMALLEALKSSCLRILAYTYPDSGIQSLESIAAQFGLQLEPSDCTTAAFLRSENPLPARFGIGRFNGRRHSLRVLAKPVLPDEERPLMAAAKIP